VKLSEELKKLVAGVESVEKTARNVEKRCTKELTKVQTQLAELQGRLQSASDWYL
jgi:hypothetical protein